VEGSVVNASDLQGVGAVNIDLFTATSLDPAVYPEEPDYQVVTLADGTYTTLVSWPKELGEFISVKLTVERNNFNTDEYDGDGTPPNDYIETDLIEKDSTYTVEDIKIKQTEFSETLEGRIHDGTGPPPTYKNGVTLWIFYNPIVADGEIGAPDTFPDGTPPNNSTFSAARPITDSDFEDGWFTFANIQWQDEDYTTQNSKLVTYIYLPTTTEISNGALSDKSGVIQKYTMTSDTDNYIEVVEP
jgi:hypothetical protein